MTSQAVIVAVHDSTLPRDGASKLGDSAPIRVSGDLYEKVLADPAIWEGEVIRLGGSELDSPQAALEKIRVAADLTAPGDRFLVVYVGHGENFGGEIHFATRSSHVNRRETWIPFKALRDAMTGQLEDKPVAADLKMLIADACHTGALPTLGAGTDLPKPVYKDDVALPGIPKITEPGTFVLTSANSQDSEAKFTPCRSVGDSDDDPVRNATPFSGHLIQLIRDGKEDGGPYFTAVELHDAVRDSMKECRTKHIAPDHDATPEGRTALVFGNMKRRGAPLEDRTAPPQEAHEWWVGQVRSGAASNLPALAQRHPKECATVVVDAASPSATNQDSGRKNVMQAQQILLDLFAEPASVATYLAELERKVPDQSHELWWLLDAALTHIFAGQARHAQLGTPTEASQLESGAIDFAKLLEAFRSGGYGALAGIALHMFGMMHEVDQLPRLVRTFDNPLDREAVLTAVALNREPQDAAKFVTLLDQENNREMVERMVADISRRRTVPDVMTFLRGVRPWPDIVKKVLDQFTGESSGRSDLDKVRLCGALRADVHFQEEECAHEYAHRVLGRAIHVAYRRDDQSARHSNVERAQPHQLPAALRYVDRDLETLRTWITTEDNRDHTPDLYADLYIESQHRPTVEEIVAWAIAHSPDRNATDELTQFAAKELSPHKIGWIYEKLANPGEHSGQWSDSNSQFRMLRHAFAAHATADKIGDLLKQLDEFTHLNSESDALLADIVENGGPRYDHPFRETQALGTICEKLSHARNRANRSLAPALRRIALERLGRRPAHDVRKLVKLAGSVRERRQLQRLAGKYVAAATLDVAAAAAERIDWCADVVRDLHSAGLSLAVKSTLRELSEPDRFNIETAERIAAVAWRIHQSSGLDKQARYLLERTLENEQGGRGMRQGDIVARTVTIIRAVFTWLPTEQRQELVQATVGRWSDTPLRYQTARRLTDAGDGQAAKWIYDVLER